MSDRELQERLARAEGLRAAHALYQQRLADAEDAYAAQLVLLGEVEHARHCEARAKSHRERAARIIEGGQ